MLRSEAPATDEPATAPEIEVKAETETETVVDMSFGGYPCSYRLLRQPDARTEPFVLLSGALQDKYGWVPSEPVFRRVADVMTIDLPGWGDSPVLDSHHGFDFLADALAEAMAHAGVERATVVGGCYGAIIAYTLAVRHPERAARLVMASAQDELADTTRAGFQCAIDALRAGDLDTFVGLIVDLYLPPTDRTEHRRRTAIARVLRRQMRQLTPRALDNYIEGTLRLLDYRPHFEALPLPTLVVNGDQDTFMPPSGGRRLAHNMDGTFVLIGGAGHMMVLERPDELADSITSFALSTTARRLPAGPGRPADGPMAPSPASAPSASAVPQII